MMRRPVRKERQWPLVLLVIPLVGLMWPDLYNTTDPEFIGIPFFYWYVLAWIILTALLIAIVYFLSNTSIFSSPERRTHSQSFPR